MLAALEVEVIDGFPVRVGGPAHLGYGYEVAPIVSRYGKDYSSYGYDTKSSRLDRFESTLARLQARPSGPLGPLGGSIPITVTESGRRDPLGMIARYAQTWHSSLDFDDYRRASALLNTMMDRRRRNRADITRSVAWASAANAEAFLAEGVTTFVVEVRPAVDGQRLGAVDELAKWREDGGRDSVQADALA